MEAIIGLRGRDFVLLAGDTKIAHSVMLLKSDVDRIVEIENHIGLAYVGEPGDDQQCVQYLAKNIVLHSMRTGTPMTGNAAAHFVRRTLADGLREHPYNVNLIMGSVDREQAGLYFLDYTGSLAEVKFCAHGYGSFFILGLLDSLYHDDVTLEQGIIMIRKCLAEIKRRLLIQTPAFCVKVITKDGIRLLSPEEMAPRVE
ncbi:putative Proteasome subunit beta type-2-B [Paratrimastix pyriformis]|uniref:Proteasome subunit beta n=1 Tax=Paratrimastix pyriformis TaxID=342808 RepID=A0ABQ8UAQ3_9EUKA|nr:putative Proteasome subunit beta type-2-B [Paratrimastix pyriformis]|eukprot:GAFH01004603.1.p1 GENE.GAFH01004603.1~~GAFH01004603.1.p1  ORF type:complete len:208 (-),score=8.82 GAFH01004603.1:139-738(-)